MLKKQATAVRVPDELRIVSVVDMLVSARLDKCQAETNQTKGSAVKQKPIKRKDPRGDLPVSSKTFTFYHVLGLTRGSARALNRNVSWTYPIQDQ